MTDGLREAAQAALTLIEDSLGRQIEPGYADMAVVARSLRAALSGESDASLRDALTDWPKFSHGVRVRTVIDMENEGVVTWGDDRHRERFLAE